MLSVFQAQVLIELKQRDKSKVESVVAYDDRLLVGLNTGSLRIYRINRSDAPEDSMSILSERKEENGATQRPQSPQLTSEQKQSLSVDLMRELERFSKQRIEGLGLIREADALLVLSNGQLQIYDVHTFALRDALSKSKGASVFTITTMEPNSDDGGLTREITENPRLTSRVAVAVKRRILIWDWRDREMVPDPKEVVLVAGIKSLTWIDGRKILAGLASNYVLVDIETGSTFDIVGPGSIGGAPGQDGGRFGGAGVAGMGYLGMTAPTPLATRLGEGEALLAKDINTHFIDTDGNPLGRRQIPWANAPDAVGYSRPYLLAVQGAKGLMEVRNPQTLSLLQNTPIAASRLYIPDTKTKWAFSSRNFLAYGDRAIWRMKLLDCDAQVDELVEQGQLDEAISLLGMLQPSRLVDKDLRMKEVKMQKAQKLFDQAKFRDAIDLFTEVSTPPERVISLYPPFIAGNASSMSPIHTRAFTEGSSDAHSDSTRHSRKASSIKSQTDQGKDPKSPSKGKGASRSNGIQEGDTRKPLEGKALKLATEELRGFLVSARTKMKKVLNPDGSLKSEGLKEVPGRELGALLVKSSFNASLDQDNLLQTAKLVDTTLFRAYMFVSPSFAGPLFRIDNFCDPDVVNEKLIEAGRYNDLVDFFYGKKLHKQALELLKKFGETEKADEAAPQLAGPQRTVAYLQSLPPSMIDLILEFAQWPLKRDPEMAMGIFLNDTENAETLPRERVLDFLHDIDLNLAVKYLEHIIHELNDTTPIFHQRLVDTYIQRLKSGYFANEKEYKEWNIKALDFLKSSRNYQAFKVLSQLDKDDPKLYEARAIVLSKMGQHKQALDIYVFRLQDPEKAEEYCNQVYLQESTQTPALPSANRARSTSDADRDIGPSSIYHTLLSLYLSPPPPHKPQWQPALSILAKHGARIPARSTLDLVPDTLPVQELEAYFRGRVRAANTVVSEGRVITGLRSALAFKEEAKLRLGDGVPGGNEGQNRRVVITEDRVCGVCFKRFGGSAVKVLPDNSVIHYGCSVR